MIALRLLVLLTAIAIAVLAAGYLISGDRRYLRWARRTLLYAGAAALIFFAILLLERLAWSGAPPPRAGLSRPVPARMADAPDSCPTAIGDFSDQAHSAAPSVPLDQVSKRFL